MSRQYRRPSWPPRVAHFWEMEGETVALMAPVLASQPIGTAPKRAWWRRLWAWVARLWRR